MFEIGDTLREARIRKDLTIKDVEHATKIRSKYLQALEDDDFEVIPGPTFVKGFLRSYADFLQIDPETLVEEYRASYEKEPGAAARAAGRGGGTPSRSPSARGRSLQLLVGAVALVIILILILVALGLRGDDEGGEETAATTTTAMWETTNEQSGGASQSENRPAASADGPAASADGPAAVDDIPAAADEVELVATGEKDAGGDGLSFSVSAIAGRCWITVRKDSAAGEPLFAGTLDEGQRASFASSAEYWLNVGNPSAIRLEIGGEVWEVPEPYGYFHVSEEGLERVE